MVNHNWLGFEKSAFLFSKTCRVLAPPPHERKYVYPGGPFRLEYNLSTVAFIFGLGWIHGSFFPNYLVYSQQGPPDSSPIAVGTITLKSLFLRDLLR